TVEELRELDIDFVCTTQGVDTSTATGKLLFGVLASIAEFELDLISERTKIGLAAARSKGKQLGRRETSIDAERVSRMREQGKSLRVIARELNVPVTTLHRRLA